MERKSRIEWMDSLKLLSAFLVLTVHFLILFAPSLTRFWSEGWTRYVLYGVTGKFAVCMFFLLAGYFAMKAKRDGMWKYIVKRYLRLVIPVFIIEVVMLIVMSVFQAVDLGSVIVSDLNNKYLYLGNMNLGMFLKDIFLLDGTVVETYWANYQLFIGPIIVVVLNGINIEEKKKKLLLICALVIFYFTGYIWYTLCVLGGILFYILQSDLNICEKWYVKIVLLIAAYFLIRHPESNLSFLLKGFACVCLMLLITHDKYVKRLLECKILKALSPYSFEIYLLHTPVNRLIVYFIYLLLETIGMPWKSLVVSSYFCSLFFTVVLSKGLHTISGKIVQSVCKQIE